MQPSINAANDIKTQQDPVSPHKLHLEIASQFRKSLKKADEVFVGFVSAIGERKFTHRTAHGDIVDTQSDPKSEALLDEIQQCYPKVFEEPTYPITKNRVLFSIQLVDNKFPTPKRKLYHFSEPELQELREQLKVLLDSSRIIPSASPYGDHILFAAKKGGTGLRIHTDYHSLNSNTITDSFPLPQIDERLVYLHGSKVFLELDLHERYHQIPIKPADCHKTAFKYRYSDLEFMVMQFGLKSAVAHFQRTMNQIFTDITDIFVLVYLDGILIFRKNEQEYGQRIYAMFSRLAENKFHIKGKKGTLFTNRIALLGHIVLYHSIEVCPNKIAAIKDWPVPITVHDVQFFLGLCNYFRCYISKFEHVARPLTDLTHKQLEFSQSPECQQAFDALKQKLFDAPVLMVFDLVASNKVQCNASNFAFGAVLIYQNTPDSPQQLVKYLSKCLNLAEYNYCMAEREFVGLIQALHTWYHYLLGRPATTRTNHASLQWLRSQSHLLCRQVHWLEFMSRFDLTIIHVPGKANIVADALLRYAYLDPARVTTVSVSIDSSFLAAIRFAQEQDSSDAFRDLKFCAIVNDRGMCMYDGLICCSSCTKGQKIVIADNKALK